MTRPAMPPRSLTFLLAFILLATGIGLLSPLHRSSADPAIDSEEAAFLQLLNDYRAQNGKAALVLHPQLNSAADWMSTDMATDNYWASSHQDNENPPRGPGARAASFGYSGGVGENLAAGFTSAQSVFTAWRNSPGHNANMLGTYKVIGIGRAYSASSTYGYYWTTDFGFVLPTGGTVPPTIAPTSSAQPTLSPTAPPTPVPTATPSPTAIPTAPPTPAPTATPVPTTPIDLWDDIDCDRDLGTRDAIIILAKVGGLADHSVTGICRVLGGGVYIDGYYRLWGDVDCSLAIDGGDAMKLLRYLSGLWFDPVDVYCPQPGIGI